MKNPPCSTIIASVFCRNFRYLVWCGVLILQLLLLPNKVLANVYATNLRFNGGTTNVTVPAVTNISITYILNEDALRGVAINISSGATPLRTINLTNPSPGTLRGTNLVAWDGKDTNGVSVGPGTYTISITASTSGYEDWTKISTDAEGNYVWEGQGIGVNKNPNSPYYGRVFVANSIDGPSAGVRPGDSVGILKLNADGSPADDSAFWNNTGGWSWGNDHFSPWKLEVSDDDKVYVNDFTTSGIILRFDQLISSESRLIVLSSNNYPSQTVSLGGLFISGTGVDTKVWMADTANPGVGIRRWQVGSNGSVATNDLGTTIVQAGAGSDLNLAPSDVAVDASNRIYTIQERLGSGDPAYRVFRFPPYAATPETNADWKIGNADDTFQGAHGIAVDRAGRYLAVAFVGDNGFPFPQNGSTRVFETTNGTPVITLEPSGDHAHTDVTWDNVGNLYTIDYTDSYWRTYSPPGTNQATTVAVVTVQLGSGSANPILSAPVHTIGQFQFTLVGQANVSYIIQSSTNLLNWAPVTTNTSPNSSRIISVSAPANTSFYRALVGQ